MKRPSKIVLVPNWKPSGALEGVRIEIQPDQAKDLHVALGILDAARLAVASAIEAGKRQTERN